MKLVEFRCPGLEFRRCGAGESHGSTYSCLTATVILIGRQPSPK
jgi:hypothetical protein